LEKEKGIYTPQFWLLCTGSFLFFSSFNMLVPELPDYLSSLGGEDYKGLIIALFTVTAGLSRPFSGKMTDTIGRVPVMIIGVVVCLVASFLYPFFTTVLPFLIIRFFHGFSAGFNPTGTAAYIADIVMPHRRGEAMGIHAMAGSLGMAFGPAIGGTVMIYFDYPVLFYTSSFLAFLSLIIVFNVKETLPESRRKPLTLSFFKLKKAEFFDKQVLPAAVVVFLAAFCHGAVITLIPDHSKALGVENKGFYFLIYTLGAIVIRLVSGKWSDKIGRTPVIKIGVVALIVCMVININIQTTSGLVVSALIYGITIGIVSPVCQAWTIDLASEHHRGRAIATMYIFHETGIGTGAFFPSLIYGNNISNLPYAYYTCLIMAVSALAFLVYYERKGSWKFI
jgi:MFS family permease